MEYTADQVWGLAVRADVINSGYVKDPVWGYSDSGESRVVKEANKVLVKQWLRDNVQPTADEVAQGQEVRRYFNTFTLKALMGKINDFERQALRIAQIDLFTGRNMLEFAIISCLPEIARRDQSRTELNREIYGSDQLQGEVGDTVVGDITVITSRYSKEYNKFKIQARMGDSFVDFWYKEAAVGELRVKGKIKQHRGNKTTQLNHVKRVS
jgi:hypothetical protein